MTSKNAAAPTATPAKSDEFDRAEFNRMFALVKSEVNGIIYDSTKKRPLYSRTVKEATAKRDAVVKSFESFLTMIESIKKE